jgi:cysteinyl-tRNA synthetase
MRRGLKIAARSLESLAEYTEIGVPHILDIHLVNTLTREKQRFVPQDPDRVTMYVCGPTVWNFAHIGNMRPVVAFDVLFRLLRHVYGADHVVYARNFTDVDDKILAAIAETGEPMEALTERFAAIYEQDCAALGALTPTIQPRATAHIGDMIDIIQTLETKGHAYPGPSGVWFCVPTLASYGRLSRRAQEDLLAGARVDTTDEKRDPADFALWKSAKPGEIAWDSPWGRGRPGWHIECSAMARAHLGVTIDIHAGGLDLIFPHHENEIAQSEAANGAVFANYWLHNGFLDIDSTKMSKSLGNVVLAHDLIARIPGEVIRFALLSAHYRGPVDWTDALVDQARATLDGWYRALARVWDANALPEVPESVLEAVADDLSTPRAFAAVSAIATAANKAATPAEMAAAKAQLLGAGQLLGLLQADPHAWLKGGAGADDAEIDAMVAARDAARAARNWAEADRLRTDLAARGVTVEDGAGGSTWRRT